MKKTTFLKTLLMAVGLCMGGNAWATTTVLYGRAVTADLENGYTAWSAADIGEGAWDGSTFYAAINANGLIIYNQDSNHETTGTLSNASQVITNSSITAPAPNSTLTYDIVWDNGSSYQHNSHYTYLSVGSGIQFRAYSQADKGEVIIGASTINIPNACVNGQNRDGDVWTIHMVVNTATNTVTELTIKGNKGATKVDFSIDEPKSIGDATFTSLALGWNRANYRPTFTTTLQSVKITEETSAATYANYTVHFVDGDGATVKADEVRNDEVGTTVNANSTDKEDYYSGNYKYVYANDGGGVEVVKAGTSEMTVTYTKYGQYTYNVYAVNSSDAKLQNDPIATATTYEDESATPKWSKYIKIGGTWYVSSESTFSATATEAGSKNVIYTPADGIDYFFEFENLAKTGSFAATEDGVELSNKNAARFSKSSKVWTSAIAAGTYTLNIYCKGTNAKSPTLPMYYCDTDGSNLVYIGEATACRANNWELKEKTGVVIPEGKALCLYNTDDKNNSNYLVDYFTLTRTGDATVSKTITAAGWATYCSPYALDFSSAIANLSAAYLVVGGADGYVTKSKITGTIPANTGILLRGEGVVTIPVVASSSTDVSANKLIGKTAEYALAAGAGYVLMNDATYGVGFYQNENAFTVGANTAYLPANFDGGTARSFFGLWNDDETTSISDASRLKDNGEMKNDNFFNLNGQRVAQPAKGLYIKNGKKMMVK